MSKKPNHTPGPWEVLHSEQLNDVAVSELKGMPLAMLRRDSTIDRRLANAHLIAAAPDMFEAIESALLQINMNWQDPNCTRLREIDVIRLSKALAKAKGES